MSNSAFQINLADSTKAGTLAAERRRREESRRADTSDPMPVGDVATMVGFLHKGSSVRLQPATPFMRQDQVKFSRRDIIAAFAKLELGNSRERIDARKQFRAWGFTVGVK